MKHYITYDEALSYFDDEKFVHMDKEHNLNAHIYNNEIFTIYWNGNLLIQKEALLSTYGIGRYIKSEYQSEIIEHKADIFDHFISTLNLKPYEDGSPGIPIIEDVVCGYSFAFHEFKESLKREGIFGFLNCTCGHIDCSGLFVKVMHFKDLIGWVLAFYQEDYPRTYMLGYLFNERDYDKYLSLPGKSHYWCESDEMRQVKERARRVLIQLPIFFDRWQLEELVRTYS